MKFKTLLLGILLSSSLSAEVFESIGYGETVESARKNAITNAIKMSVGEFVVNKQELDNEDYFEKTVNYSNAYVKSSKVISEQQIDNEYEVKVLVDIESQKLLEAVKEAQTAKVTINKNKLKQKISENEQHSAHNESHHFENLVNELLLLPLKENKELISVKIISDVEPIGTKNNQGEIPFEFKIEIEPSAAYRENVKRIAKEMEPVENRPTSYVTFVETKLKGEGLKNVVITNPKDIKVDSEKRQVLSEIIGNRQPDSLNIQLISSSGYEIKSEKFPMIVCDPNAATNPEYKTYGIYFSCYDDQPLTIDEQIKRNATRLRINDLINYIGFNVIRYAYGKIALKVRFNLTEDEVEDLQDIKVFFSND